MVLLFGSRYLHSLYACANIHPLVQQKTISDVIFAQCAAQSNVSLCIQIVKQLSRQLTMKIQLLQRINRTSSLSNPKWYCRRITIDVADTAGPAQQQTSRHRHGTGHAFSPHLPFCIVYNRWIVEKRVTERMNRMSQNHKKIDNIVSDYISGANGRNRNSQRKTKHIVTYNLY